MIQLGKFCGGDPLRPYLNEPFSRGDYTYATDGRIMVRVPRCADVADGGGPLKDPDAPLKDEATATYYALAKADLPEVKEADCSACSGRGHEHDCPDCECVCDRCVGSGREFEKVSVAIGDVPFQLRYVAKMLSLPSVQIAEGNKGEAPLLFRFEGGIGSLMPLRTPYGRHLTPFAKDQVETHSRPQREEESK